MGKFIDLVIRGKDLFSSKSDKAAESIGSLKTEIKSLDKQLKQVEAAQENVQIFKELSTQSEQLSQALDESKASLVAYTKAQASSSAKLDKTAQSVNELKLNSKELTVAYKAQSAELNKSEISLTKASAKMRDYASTLESSEKSIKDTNAQYQKQKQSLEQLDQKYRDSKKPVDDLNTSYKVAQSQLTALEKVQAKQVAELEKTKANYQQSANEVERLSSSQKTLKDAVQGTTTTLKKVNAELVDLKASQLTANQALETSTRNYKASAKATETLEKNLKTVNTQLGKTESKLKQSAVDTKSLGDATSKLAAKQKALVTETKKSYTALAKMSSQLTGMKKGLNTFGNGVGSVTKQLLAMGGAYVGIRTLWTSLKNFIGVGAKFDTFRKQFEGIMGSVSEGEHAFEWVKEFARDTPLDMEQVTQAFIVLKGSGLDPMGGSLLALTNATAKYTGGTSKLEAITRQLSQAWAKGKISAEDMKTATENGLPAWTLLAQATGKTVGELRNLSEQGKLGRYELKLLFAELQSDAPGAAAALMGTFNGQMAIAKFNVQDFLDTVAQSGALDFLLEKLTGLNKQVSEMAEDGSLKKLAKELSDKFIEMAKNVSSAVQSIFTDLSGFASSVKSTFVAISIPINVFTALVKGMTFVVAESVGFIARAFSGLTSGFGLFSNSVSRALDDINNMSSAVSDVAFEQMKEDADDLKEAINTLKGAADKTTISVENLGDEAIKSADKIETASDKIKKSVDAIKLNDEAAVNLGKTIVALGVDFADSFSSVEYGNGVFVNRRAKCRSLFV